MMPVPLLESYINELASLEAGELMEFATAVAVGTGSLKKGQGKRIMDRWERTANRGTHRIRVQTVEEIKTLMATVTG